MQKDKLLQYYQHEMDHFEQQCKMFSEKYPLAAQQLSINPQEINTPSNSHLIQTIALNNAQLKQQIEQLQNKQLQALIEKLFPQLSIPLAASALTTFKPAKTAEQACFVKKGTMLETFSKEKNRYQFQTTRDVTIYPLQCSSAEICHCSQNSSSATHYLELTLTLTGKAKCFSKVGINEISCYLQGQFADKLYTLINTSSSKATLFSNQQEFTLNDEQCTALSDDNNSLQQLINYAHFSSQYMGFILRNLKNIIQNCKDNTLKIRFYFQSFEIVEQLHELRSNYFSFNAVPITNCFKKTIPPIIVDNKTTEYRLLADSRPQLKDNINQVITVLALDEHGQCQTILPLDHSADPQAPQYHIRQELNADNTVTLWLSITNSDTLHKKMLLIEALCSNKDPASNLTQEMSQPEKLQSIYALNNIQSIDWLTPLTVDRHAILHHINLHNGLSLITSNQQSLLENNAKGLKQQLGELIKSLKPNMIDLLQAIDHVSMNIHYIRQKNTPTGSLLPCLHVHLYINDEQIDLYQFASLSFVIDAFIQSRSHINSLLQTHIHSTNKQRELWKWPIKCGKQAIA